MKVVRDCPDAKYLPARYNFALPRLIALLLWRPGSAPGERRVLAVGPGQSSLEMYAVTVWITATVSLYAASLLPPRLAFLGFPIAVLAIQLLVAMGGLLIDRFGSRQNVRANSVLFMTVLFAASSWFGAAAGAVRFVAWSFFTIVFVNIVAWLILHLMGRRIRALEQACGI